MKRMTFAALAALILLASGCASVPPGAADRFIASFSDEHPVRKGIIENGEPYPVEVYIDGELAGQISQKYYGYFSVTAKEAHKWYVKDLNGNVVRREQELIVPDAPLGSHYVIPPRKVKVIDTGWIRYI